MTYKTYHIAQSRLEDALQGGVREVPSSPFQQNVSVLSQNKFCKVRGLEMPDFLWTDARWRK